MGAFGVQAFNAEVRKTATPGDLETQAGSNPYDGVTDFTFNTSGLTPDGNVKNIRVDLPPGLVSNPEATPEARRHRGAVPRLPRRRRSSGPRR